jgi:hypothetical protein
MEEGMVLLLLVWCMFIVGRSLLFQQRCLSLAVRKHGPHVSSFPFSVFSFHRFRRFHHFENNGCGNFQNFTQKLIKIQICTPARW